MEITRGKQIKGVKFLVYGPEGIGKSTFVSKIPGVVFIDTEGSTGEMDVLRLPTPKSWSMLLETVKYALANPEQVRSLVIDTGDWAERLCIDHVLATHLINGQKPDSIEAYGYGKGYVYLYEAFGELLNIMEEMSVKGQHVGFTAHAMMRKFEQPDENGSYDRWELKMSKKVAPLVKEWSSLMLFANYKTYVYATDDKGKKHKASGGQRTMYATHHPCWDAKNRYGLPDEMPFDYSAVAHVFDQIPVSVVKADPVVSAVQEAKKEAEKVPEPVSQPKQSMEDVLATGGPVVGMTDKLPEKTQLEEKVEKAVVNNADYTGVPPALVELMKNDGISPFEVKAAIAQRGYFPLDTPFENYPADFVQGVLIGAWPQVKNMVLQNRNGQVF